MSYKHLENIPHLDAYKLIMFHESEKNTILAHQPWIISYQVVMFEDYEKFLVNPNNFFMSTVFWLQLLHLPVFLVENLSLNGYYKMLEVDLISNPLE